MSERQRHPLATAVREALITGAPGVHRLDLWGLAICLGAGRPGRGERSERRWRRWVEDLCEDLAEDGEIALLDYHGQTLVGLLGDRIEPKRHADADLDREAHG